MVNTTTEAPVAPGTGARPGAVVVTGVSKAFGAAPVLRAVDLTVPAGHVVALLGPSGCGKTTLLRIVAGLDRPDDGEVRVGDRLLAGPGEAVPPERRRIGMVFQDWALFPHLSVARNVAYGLHRLRGAEREARVREALELVGLADLGARQPGTLSGGQQQRVALARALAPRPEVLLLDEPFSNLDTALRVEVRAEVHRLLATLGITTLFVTHDQEEAFVLGDQVAVMDAGRIVQQDRPAALYHDPASAFVAAFVGDANLLAGTARGDLADTAVGTVALRRPAQGPVTVLLRPEDCKLRPGGTDELELVEFYGHDTLYRLRPAGGPELRVRQAGSPLFGRGDRVAVEYVGGPTSAYPA